MLTSEYIKRRHIKNTAFWALYALVWVLFICTCIKSAQHDGDPVATVIVTIAGSVYLCVMCASVLYHEGAFNRRHFLSGDDVISIVGPGSNVTVTCVGAGGGGGVGGFSEPNRRSSP